MYIYYTVYAYLEKRKKNHFVHVTFIIITVNNSHIHHMQKPIDARMKHLINNNNYHYYTVEIFLSILRSMVYQ